METERDFKHILQVGNIIYSLINLYVGNKMGRSGAMFLKLNFFSTKKRVILVLLLLLSGLFFISPRLITFYISNQNNTEPYVNISIKDNGVLIITDEFDHANSHNWQKYFIVTWGSFQSISAINKKDNVTKEETFFMPAGGYIIINYWNSPTEHTLPKDQFFTIEFSMREPNFI